MSVMVCGVNAVRPLSATMRSSSLGGSQARIALPVAAACAASGISAEARIDAHRMPRLAAQDVDEIGVLHDRKLDGFLGLIVQAIEKTLRASRQIHLPQAGSAEMENARPQNVAAAVGAARDVAPIVQGRDQVMTGRDIQSGGRRDLGQLRFAAGIRQDVENEKGAIERLDAAMVPSHRRTRRHDASPSHSLFRTALMQPSRASVFSALGPVPQGQSNLNFHMTAMNFIT